MLWSLVLHGVVLAAVLLAPVTGPPAPVPAVVVELLREAGGSVGAERAAGSVGAGPKSPAEAALGEPASALPAAPPVPAAVPSGAAAEGAPEKLVQPPPRRPARPASVKRQPAGSADRPENGSVRASGAERGAAAAAGSEPAATSGSAPDGAGEGREVVGGGGEGAPPGFALGSPDNPLPHYPTVARRRGIEGTVTLEVRVDSTGLPERVALARSSGSSLLDEAALEAVRRWRFRPARRAGEPVAGIVTVPITFRLLEPQRAALR